MLLTLLQAFMILFVFKLWALYSIQKINVFFFGPTTQIVWSLIKDQKVWTEFKLNWTEQTGPSDTKSS